MAALDKRWPVLTIRQPWCSAIAFGDKRVENRPRYMAYRGPLWLHAGLAVEWDAPSHAWLAAGLAPFQPRSQRDAWRHSLVLGAVLAAAEVIGCHWHEECRDSAGEMCYPWAADSQWHIELAPDVRPLRDPVPCKGALGLWRLPEDVEKAVRAQLEATDARQDP